MWLKCVRWWILCVVRFVSVLIVLMVCRLVMNVCISGYIDVNVLLVECIVGFSFRISVCLCWCIIVLSVWLCGVCSVLIYSGWLLMLWVFRVCFSILWLVVLIIWFMGVCSVVVIGVFSVVFRFLFIWWMCKLGLDRYSNILCDWMVVWLLILGEVLMLLIMDKGGGDCEFMVLGECVILKFWLNVGVGVVGCFGWKWFVGV